MFTNAGLKCKIQIKLQSSLKVLSTEASYIYKGVFKGGFRGFKPPPEIFRFFLKSEGKEIERKRKKGMLGGGGVVTS